MRVFRSLVVACILFGGSLLSNLSCRELNPAFLPEQDGTQGSSTLRVSTAQTSSSPGLDTDESSQDEGASETTTPASQGTSQGSPGQTDPASQSTGSDSSNENESASAAPPSVCPGKATYCYAMNNDGGSYPGLNGQGPPLELVQGEGTLSHQQQAGSVLFADHLKVDGGGRVRTNQVVNTGSDSLFGFDVAIRDIGCSKSDPCYLTVVGDLALKYHPVDRSMYCLSFASDEANDHDTGQAIKAMDPGGINQVACFAQDNKIYLVVNGQIAVGTRENPAVNLTTLRYSLGALRTSQDFSNFTGDIGRFRYWSDPQAMLRAVKAGE